MQPQNVWQGELKRAAILGLGLMGASLGMALRRAGMVRPGAIAAYDAAPGVAERARERGAIDVAAASAEAAVAGADLVVLAVPVLAMCEVLAAIAPQLAPDAIVTDLGSTKAEVVTWAEALLLEPSTFVGGHPMAGSERSGIEAAEPDLFQGCAWCLTPTPRTDVAVSGRLARLIERLGAHVMTLSPEQHDSAVAAVSHLPLLAATALTLTAADRPDWSTAQDLAAGGFRDTSRVASGDPRMARDICLTNTQPILECLDAYLASLQALRAAVAARDPSIEETFAAARRARDRWLQRPSP
jgi:prephenate dehydrogenase